MFALSPLEFVLADFQLQGPGPDGGLGFLGSSLTCLQLRASFSQLGLQDHNLPCFLAELRLDFFQLLLQQGDLSRLLAHLTHTEKTE